MIIKSNNQPAYSENWKELNNLKGIELFVFDILKPASSLAAIYQLQKNH